MTEQINRKLCAFNKLFFALCLAFLSLGTTFAQNLTVKGVVEDPTGNLISDATVAVNDKKVQTDAKGRFEIPAVKGVLLTVSKTGFATQYVKASSAVGVVLKPKMSENRVELLYQQVSGKEVTSSVSTLDSKGLTNNSVLAFSNALYGRIAGLNLSQRSGEPGDDYATLLVRGKHTFTGSNAPLVLVDGFRRDFNTLSVDEVESVSVLKDAASAALYGMEGANGVILVTTKRGIVGKSSIGFKVEYGVKTPSRMPKFYGSYDYAAFYNQAQLNDGKTTLQYTAADLTGYKLAQDPYLYPNVDWTSETIRKYAPTTKYSVDFRGGNQVAKYYVNVGVVNDEGIFKNSDHYDGSGKYSYSTNRNLDRVNFRSNVDVNVTKRLSLRMDLSGRFEGINSPTADAADIFNNLYNFHPNVAPVFVAPGQYGGSNTYRKNPVAYINEQGYRTVHRRYFQSNVIAKYDLSDLIKGLAVGVRTTFDNYYTVKDGYTKAYNVRKYYRSVAQTDSLSELYKFPNDATTSLSLTELGASSDYETRSTNFETYAEYNRTFGKHKVGALALYHQDETVTTVEFPARRVSVSGKLSYGYDNRYFVDFAAQYGGSENFMKGKRMGFYPAVSGAWVISSEPFMANVEPVSYLKVRLSTGLVGNQNVGGTRFGYRTLYSTTGAELPIGNPNLTWEKAYKTDLGADVVLFNDVQLSATYFNEFRDDILNSGSALMPDYFGNSFGYINYGQVKSHGFEASVSKSRQFATWGYNLGANVTFVRNKVTRMKEVTRKDAYLYRQGQPVGQRFGLEAIGLFQSQAEIDGAPTQMFGKVIPGSIRYKDQNGDNIINSDDQIAIGKDASVPDCDLGFNIGFNVKGFYVDANFQAEIGREVNLRDDTEGAMYSVSPLYGDKNVSTFVKNPWTVETAAYADYPSLTIENGANNYQTSTYWLRNGDFLRLRALELGYNFPKSWIKGLRLSSANIYLRGMNILTLDNIKYFDPEVMEGYPLLKSYNVGINLKF